MISKGVHSLQNPVFTPFKLDDWSPYATGSLKNKAGPPQLWDAHLDTFLDPQLSPLAGEMSIPASVIYSVKKEEAATCLATPSDRQGRAPKNLSHDLLQP